jgi:hypothetical protein
MGAVEAATSEVAAGIQAVAVEVISVAVAVAAATVEAAGTVVVVMAVAGTAAEATTDKTILQNLIRCTRNPVLTIWRPPWLSPEMKGFLMRLTLLGAASTIFMVVIVAAQAQETQAPAAHPRPAVLAMTIINGPTVTHSYYVESGSPHLDARYKELELSENEMTLAFELSRLKLDYVQNERAMTPQEAPAVQPPTINKGIFKPLVTVVPVAKHAGISERIDNARTTSNFAIPVVICLGLGYALFCFGIKNFSRLAEEFLLGTNSHTVGMGGHT